MVEGAREKRCGRIVDDERNAIFAPDRSDFGDRKDDELRIGKRLGIIGAGPVVGRAPKILRIGGIDEADFDALRLQRIGKEIPGAAIEVSGRYDIVAGARDVLQRERRSRLTRGDG